MNKLIILLIGVTFVFGSQHPYRKYEHVKAFIKPLAWKSIEVSMQNDVPPAAMLAIACVESGYGKSYTARISANIMNLASSKGEKRLPRLYLPHVKKTYKILYNPKEIANYDDKELRYKKRPKSRKKDYRPSRYAGTKEVIDYFDQNPNIRVDANMRNMEDFAKVWISESHRYEAFRKARKDLDKKVDEQGKNVLFEKEISVEFIHNIGGKKNSFSLRQSWPRTVVEVMEKVGLVELIQEMKNGESFEDAWQKGL